MRPNDFIDPGQSLPELSRIGRRAVRWQVLFDCELSDVEYIGDISIPRHEHERGYLIVVLNGAQYSRSPQGHHFWRTGSISFVQPGVPHTGDNLLAQSRVFHVGLPIDLRIPHEAVSHAQDLSAHPCADTLVRLYREFRYSNGEATLELESLTYSLMEHLGRTPRHNDGGATWLRSVRDRLHDDLSRSPRLGELAEDIGVNRAHLARSFKAHYGQTIGDYVRRLRVTRAMEQLASDDRPLAQLARQLGFFDQAHFCHVFKRHTGCSPSEYKTLAR